MMKSNQITLPMMQDKRRREMEERRQRLQKERSMHSKGKLQTEKTTKREISNHKTMEIKETKSKKIVTTY